MFSFNKCFTEVYEPLFHIINQAYELVRRALLTRAILTCIRGSEGGMVKDHTFPLFFYGTSP